MVPRAGPVACFLLAALSAAGTAHAADAPLLVAIGGTGDAPGAARHGAPARVADRIARTGLRFRVVDLTAAEASAASVRGEQLLRAVSLRPSVVSVAIGALDAHAGASLKGFSRELHVIADLLRRTPATVVLATIPLPAGDDPASRSRQRRVEAFNWAIVRTAERHGFVVADLGRERPGDPDAWEAATAHALEGALAPRPRSPVRPGKSSSGRPDELAARSGRAPPPVPPGRGT